VTTRRSANEQAKRAAQPKERQLTDRGSWIADDNAPPASSSSLHPLSSIPDPQSSSSSIQNSKFNIQNFSSITPLPEVYAKAAPMLRCSSGQVFHTQLNDTLGLHLAFFEWDGTDTGSVLEAFRHMPEACMGSIGMILIEKAPPRSYVVRGSGIEDRGSKVRDQEQATAPSSSSYQQSTINNPQSSISPSSNSTSNIKNSKLPQRGESLVFDHTILSDPGQGGGLFASGAPVHAFRAVWVSGLSLADARQGLGGDEFDRLRTIRLKSALTRFRPTHARVIQGAVRGAPNADAAWKAFEQTMLADLTFENR